MIIKVLDSKGYVRAELALNSVVFDKDDVFRLLDLVSEYPVEDYTYRVIGS